jgi:hypothetical protein
VLVAGAFRVPGLVVAVAPERAGVPRNPWGRRQAQRLIRWRRIGLRHREHAIRVFYLLLLAIPFGALALLSLLAFLGALAVGGTMYVAGAVAAGARYVARGRSEAE